jgi:hypothetical protein
MHKEELHDLCPSPYKSTHNKENVMDCNPQGSIRNSQKVELEILKY